MNGIGPELLRSERVCIPSLEDLNLENTYPTPPDAFVTIAPSFNASKISSMLSSISIVKQEDNVPFFLPPVFAFIRVGVEGRNFLFKISSYIGG